MRVVRPFCRLLGLAVLILSGCAKPPSAIDVHITADDTVPLVTLLRSTVVRASDPSSPAVLKWVAAGGADPDAGVGGFLFPMVLHVGIHPTWSGPVSLTVDGLDFYVTDKVIATGTTQATIVSEQTTTASLTLTGVPGGGGGAGDAGADSGSDAGAAADAGAPAGADCARYGVGRVSWAARGRGWRAGPPGPRR